MCIPLLLVHTLNALLLASTATATGPALATAAFKSDSLPLVTNTLPEMRAPTLPELNVQENCYIVHVCCTHD